MQEQSGQLKRLGEEQGRWLLSGLHPSHIARPPAEESNGPGESA